ncbi:MAG TPA: VWA domain-containing protein [Candidatus Kapabacteria bacterium]|nr:VWA domain-containing protein [Candidatus Kapabacteria bacterium]
MDTFSLGFSGSAWFISFLLIIAVIFVIIYYLRTIPPVPVGIKMLLGGIRGLAIVLLVLVLFEPILSVIQSGEKKPKLAVLIDNSLSNGFRDALGDRQQAVRKAIENSNIQSLNDEEILYYSFDTDVKPFEVFNFDSLNFKGQTTNISNAVSFIGNKLNEENIRSVLLITDGEFNEGTNPIYFAEKSARNYYAIGIGDSSESKDISISSIITNEIAYVDNPVPVNVQIKTSGYSSGNITCTLMENNFVIEKKDLQITPQTSTLTAMFSFTPKKEGISKITAKISSLDGEITDKNNIKSDFIKVLKNKRRISIFSGSPNPDLSFLLNTFSNEKGLEIRTFIQKKGAEFYNPQPTKQEVLESEMIVFVGFPISSTPANVIEMIKEALQKEKPLLFIASQQTDYSKLNQFQEFLPFTLLSTRANEFSVIADLKREALANPLIRIYGTEKDLQIWNNLPPIFRTETFVKPKPESEVISTFKVNNVPMQEPLILSRSFQNKKSITVMGYGLYRWKLLGYAADVSKNNSEAVDVYSIFINNAVKWLSVDQNEKNIRIRTSKQQYVKNEPVEFIAQVYDAAFTPIDNANVNIKISSGQTSRDVTLNSLGNGRYTAKVEGLAEGDFFYQGSVEVNQAKLGSASGRFSIGDIALEYINLQMNAPLLRNLSARTGGNFYTPETVNTFLDDIKKNPNFKPVSFTDKYESALWNLPYILAAVILLFAMEWFLRKKFGMI